AASARLFPASHASRVTGCVKSMGNSSASPWAALNPSNSEESDKQYSTACSTQAGAARSAPSGVNSGSSPADAQSVRWTCRKRLSRCSASSRRTAASIVAIQGLTDNAGDMTGTSSDGAGEGALAARKGKRLEESRRRKLPADAATLEHETAIRLPVPLAQQMRGDEDR